MKTIILMLALMPFYATAHSGRTADDDCHYCRTNCEAWGEIEGERHCHVEAEPPTEADPEPETKKPRLKRK